MIPLESFTYSDKVEREGSMISDVYFEKVTLVTKMSMELLGSS